MKPCLRGNVRHVTEQLNVIFRGSMSKRTKALDRAKHVERGFIGGILQSDLAV